jgi:hypothetical protein
MQVFDCYDEQHPGLLDFQELQQLVVSIPGLDVTEQLFILTVIYHQGAAEQPSTAAAAGGAGGLGLGGQGPTWLVSYSDLYRILSAYHAPEVASIAAAQALT